MNKPHTPAPPKRATSEDAPWWLRIGGIVVLFALVLVGWLHAPNARQTAASHGSEVRGIALGLFASDPEYNYGPMLREIVDHGATDLLIALVWVQRDLTSTEIAPQAGYSPSLPTYRRTLQQARRLGLRIAVMPMVRLQQRRADEWRGRLRPTGGPIPWFASYTRYLERIAKIAQEEGVSRLAVGSELGSLEPYTQAWRALIQRIRRLFSGKLFYSANWDHLDQIGFADALDEMAVTGYLPMATDERWPSPQAMHKRWSRFFRDLREMQRRWKRPIFLSEVGYPALASAARYPWDETHPALPDPALQSHLWQGFCAAYHTAQTPPPNTLHHHLTKTHGRSGDSKAPSSKNKPHLIAALHGLSGFFVWNWFGFGGISDTSFTPRGKPLARRLERCLQRGYASSE